MVHSLNQVELSWNIEVDKKKKLPKFYFLLPLSPIPLPVSFSSFPSKELDLTGKQWAHLPSKGALFMFELWNENYLWVGFSAAPSVSSRACQSDYGLGEGSQISEGIKEAQSFCFFFQVGSWRAETKGDSALMSIGWHHLISQAGSFKWITPGWFGHRP